MGLGDLCRQYLMNGFRHIRIVWILQIFSRVLRQPAPGRYSKVPCADHSDEPLNAEIVFASGLHDFLSFISIAQTWNFPYLFFLAASLSPK